MQPADLAPGLMLKVTLHAERLGGQMAWTAIARSVIANWQLQGTKRSGVS